MTARRSSTIFYVLAGLVALFAFTGDIVTDAVGALYGDHCACEGSHSESQQPDKSPCSNCSCAVHNGFMIASTSPMTVSGAAEGTLLPLKAVEAVPPRLPVAIDHPPQLT
jgi:hypothetical protein